MENPVLIPYMRHFQSLNRAHNLGGAPHKPILLLSVAQLILDGAISDNRIRITEELAITFKKNWDRFVITRHTLNFAMPFYHMGSEPFWQIVPYPGMEIALTASKSIRSFKNLLETLNYAWMDESLFLLLQDPSTNRILTDVLLNTYFPETKTQFREELPLFLTGTELLVNEKVGLAWEMPILKVTKDQREQEVFLRSALFKREVRIVYHYQCAISGLKAESPKSNVRLIDACHIQPFSTLQTEFLANGITLTPTLHRAFDAGFITIDENYCVKVSASVSEEKDSPYALYQFHGKEILLPAAGEHYPSMESLEWHWKERFIY